SKGQDLERGELEALAVSNACTQAGDSAERKRFKLARDVCGLEKATGRRLTPGELVRVFKAWYHGSLAFLDSGETYDTHLASFLGELEKVRVPTGEGDTLNRALETVWKLSRSELPVIPGMPEAPENLRRSAALHRELSRLCGNGTYFLSYRDAAKACDGLSHQLAHKITSALVRLGVIRIVLRGKARPNGGKASEFRYLLPIAIQPF